MKKYIALSVLLFVSVFCFAQISLSDYQKYPCLTFTNYLPYDQAVKTFNALNGNAFDYPTLSPAPSGYKPFYISFYGRHGQRYHYNGDDYNYYYRTLDSAYKAGVLSDFGKDFYKEFSVIYSDAVGRAGDLTPMGSAQHNGIALRMMNNFPEVFNSGRDKNINVVSSVVPRCLLSANAFCMAVKSNYPQITINCDASQKYMEWISTNSNAKPKRTEEFEKKNNEFNLVHSITSDPFSRIFSDSLYVNSHINKEKFVLITYHMVCTLQGVEIEGINSQCLIFSLLSSTDMVNAALRANLYWYSSFGKSDMSKYPDISKNLWQRMIIAADTAINGGKCRANLIFGHDTGLLPLLCDLGVDNARCNTTDFEHLNMLWNETRYIPMAGNLQFVFYRSKKSDRILVKVLLNEHEATLPLKAVEGCYYDWKDVKALNK